LLKRGCPHPLHQGAEAGAEGAPSARGYPSAATGVLFRAPSLGTSADALNRCHLQASVQLKLSWSSGHISRLCDWGGFVTAMAERVPVMAVSTL